VSQGTWIMSCRFLAFNERIVPHSLVPRFKEYQFIFLLPDNRWIDCLLLHCGEKRG